MARASLAELPAGTARTYTRQKLFKRDRPRTVDRYIDYFGERAIAFRDRNRCPGSILTTYEHARTAGTRGD